MATAGVILAALYLLWAYQRVFHGPAEGENADMKDLTAWERLMILPLVVGIVFLGVYPKPMLERMEPAIDALVVHVEEQLDGGLVRGVQHRAGRAAVAVLPLKAAGGPQR